MKKIFSEQELKDKILELSFEIDSLGEQSDEKEAELFFYKKQLLGMKRNGGF